MAFTYHCFYFHTSFLCVLEHKLSCFVFILFHIFLLGPKHSATRLLPLTEHQKNFFLFLCHSFFLFFWSRLIQFNTFLRPTVNQLEKGVRENIKSENYPEQKNEKIYYRFDVSLSRDFSLFFYLFFCFRVMKRGFRCHLSKLKCPIREARRGGKYLFRETSLFHLNR